MSYTLRVDTDWASQITNLRHAISEDTNLIRFDNGFYRVCRPGDGRISLTVSPRTAPKIGLLLTMRTSDLYIETIGGLSFSRYASTLAYQRPTGISLDDAIHKLSQEPRHPLRPQDRFIAQSVIVFCVAESLRFNQIGTAVQQAIIATHGQLLGVSSQFPINAWSEMAKNWGQTSEAIFAAMSDEARNIVLKPRASLSSKERQFSERVDTSKLGGKLGDFARAITVLKRPPMG
ncbi:ribosome-inactivating family protein [Burkholderia oklahomensis]|uniref:Ribosome inactivating family protein n=1 Tax=Burkholderia oklahomensis TaxID=342113 RepID=A0AAI8FPW9_9BURK|nr:ribosome-inactivating family protein [Burkholderia oklahomensis]AIO68370.1 ribosome inactivating family protein [Burkholderia oklahomensis]AJX32852.1 ribosome inactivating family protein [Burkholderia oklahomensis C6786]AOI41423.1 hypothetical protein WG70_17125 [Burkholderia oklahomensis EO147]AOI45028.1 hypothetical protein WI23_03960 [Burkholderia oklahomensis C6786]KUY63911.1 hypothetical protein WG70_30795 [Burkholderia oklahomensis EO147]